MKCSVNYFQPKIKIRSKINSSSQSENKMIDILDAFQFGRIGVDEEETRRIFIG